MFSKALAILLLVSYPLNPNDKLQLQIGRKNQGQSAPPGGQVTLEISG